MPFSLWSVPGLFGRWWLPLAAACAAAALLVGGYHAGCRVTAAEYERDMGLLRLAHAQEQTQRARAHAQAYAALHRQYEKELSRGNALSAQLDEKRRQIARQRMQFDRRIRDVVVRLEASGTDCRLGPDFVRLWNEAIGAVAHDSGGGSLSGAAGTAPVTDTASGAAGTADTGILAGQAAPPSQRTGTVTPADLLANIRDYGARCRAMEVQLNSLIDWVQP
jgi:hypothetical protein